MTMTVQQRHCKADEPDSAVPVRPTASYWQHHIQAIHGLYLIQGLTVHCELRKESWSAQKSEVTAGFLPIPWGYNLHGEAKQSFMYSLHVDRQILIGQIYCT